MIMPFFIVFLGFVVLIKGADLLVKGASALARKYRVSDIVIGLTIVSFGTSAPELLVNIIAAYQNHPEIVLSNVIGSNLFNLFVVLGIAGIISPLIVKSGTVWKEIPISFFAILLLFLLSNKLFFSQNQLLSRVDGFVLLVFFGFFMIYIFHLLKSNIKEGRPEHIEFSVLKICLFILLGLTALLVGARLIVNNAIMIAVFFNVSEKLIGLTIVAIGTSLPELATSVVAAIKKNNDIAVGNIIGSNIFNIFLILGLSSVVRPLRYNTTLNTDLAFLAFGTAFFFLAMFSGGKKKLDRWEAAVLLLLYLVYFVYSLQKEFLG